MSVGSQTKTEFIKSARKNHRCSWCGESIGLLESYLRYRWYDGSDATTVKLHEECMDALDKDVAENGEVEFTPGDNRRGCNCQFCPECDYCLEKNLTPTQQRAR